MENNSPLLGDPFEGVKHKQDEAQQANIEFQRLCYETFIAFPDGKRLYEHMRDHYLLKAVYSPADPQSKELALFWEGFRECIRGMHLSGKVHEKRITKVNT